MDLRDELALLRSLLGTYIQDNSECIDTEFIENVGKLLDKTSRIHAAIVKHEQAKRGSIPMALMPLLIKGVASVIAKYVDDERARRSAADDIANLKIFKDVKIVDVESD